MKIRTEQSISAAHVLLDYVGKCSRIHGHNWRIEVEIEGKKNEETNMLIDFTIIKNVINILDHKMILPSMKKHPEITISSDSQHIRLLTGKGMYMFPMGDCVFVPVDNITAENIAEYLTRKIYLEVENRDELDSIRVIVWESAKSYAEDLLTNIRDEDVREYFNGF